MTNRDTKYTEAEQRVRDAVRAMAAERPDPEYRARIGRAFVSGALKSTAPARPAFPLRELGLALAAAAAFVVVAFAFNRGPEWQVVRASGAGTATVDGHAVALTPEALAPVLRRGGHVVLPDSASLELVAPGQLAVSLTGGTDAELPAAPNRWFARHASGRVTVGEAYIQTGRRFHGATLDMITPEANAHVTGTSLAVLRDKEAGTCVCVMQGKVAVSYEEEDEGKLERETLMVPQGQRCICPPGGEAKLGPILHSSEHALHQLGTWAAEALER